MKKLLVILLFFIALFAQAKDLSISLVPTNLVFNTIGFDVENRINNHSYVVGFGIPVWISMEHRFGIKHSDYNVAKLGTMYLRMGFREYYNNWYLEPYIKFQDIMNYMHLQIRPSYPLNSTIHNYIYTESVGMSIGHKWEFKKLVISSWVGAEVGNMSMQLTNNNISKSDADYMSNVFFPDELQETLTPKMYNHTYIYDDGNRVKIKMGNTFYPMIHIGVSIGLNNIKLWQSQIG